MKDDHSPDYRLGARVKGGHEILPPRDKVVVNALIGAVIAMLIPLLIVHVTGVQESLSITIPAAFLIVLALLSALHMGRGHRLPGAALAVTVWICIVQVLPLWWGGFLGDPLLIGDVANTVAKPLSFLLFLALFFRADFSRAGVSLFAGRFAWIVFIVALYGLVDGLASFIGLGLGVSSYSVDYSSFLANRNQLGMLLFLGLAFLLIARAVRGPARFDLLIGLTLSISIVLTMSRGSLLGAILLAVVVVALRVPASFFLLLLPTAGLATFLLSLNHVVREYVAHFLIRPEVGLSGRDTIWSIGWGLATERPLQGWGAHVGLAEAETRGMVAGQLHSFWLEQLVDWGALGLTTILVVFIIVWSRAYRQSPRPVRHVLLGVGIGAAALASVESINVLSVGYVDVIWTISLLTVPVLLSRVNWSRPELGVVAVNRPAGVARGNGPR